MVEINIINIRDFSNDKHGKVDDYIFGGGDGMLMMPAPLYDAINSVKTEKSWVIYLSPKGTPLKQAKVKELAKTKEHLVLVIQELSIGDYVLTGGEIPAMALTDAVCRYIPNVLHNENSTEEESFSDNYLEYPQYTRPQEFMGLKVPEVLLSGNHAKIKEWREEQKIIQTKKYRPDLLDKKD